MMRRASIFALLATAMTFAAEGEQYVLVHATVSHVVSVTLSGYGGARTAPGDFNLAINYPYTLNFTPATGYTPKGWEVTTNGVRVLSGNTTDAITINTLAYGGCSLLFYGKANEYTVYLDRQDGNGGSGSVTATYDGQMPYLSGWLRIRDGYKFGGYFTAANGGGTMYYNADGNSARTWNIPNNNTTLYAKWTAETYNVSLNRSGGKGWTPVDGDTSVTVTHAAPMPQASMPTYPGYTFGGYYADINGRGTKYYDENGSSATNWTKTTGGTLQAYWIPNTYAVTLDRQGGTNGTNTVTATYDSAMPSATMPTRDGYTFGGYYTGTGGSGTQYYTANGTSAQNWNIPSNTTLYAKWTGGEYAVTLDKQSGTNGTSSVTATYGSAMPSIDVPTREGYAFTGYYAGTGGTGTQYYNADGTSAQNWDRTSATTLYANWTGIVYTVTFNANGGTGEMEPLICTYDVPTNLPPCTFARDGWGFSGWTTNGATGVLFADGALVSNLTTTAGAQVELLACWSSDTYDVVFDARDWRGDGWMTNGTEDVNVLTTQVNVGETWNLPVPTNAKPHLAFVGWKDDQGQLVVNGTMVPPQSAGATNLVAVWSDSLAAAVDAPTLEFRTFGTVGKRIAPVGDLVDPYAADWFPQTNFLYGSTNAAQSGALPVESLTQSYVSWLITTVEGKGVLSFSWKCDAQEEFMGAGDTIRFGLFDATLGITNEIARLKNHDDWRSVSYINDSQSVVSFAWAFVYTAGAHNGGGTGWVDRVTWRPEGSSGEETQVHSVPFTWLRTKFPEYENADEAALEALAETNSPNNKAWSDGRGPVMVWQDYWAGTDPNDPDDLFRALISVTNGVPYISWQPDLSVTGTPPRVYRVLCSPIPSASAQDWVEWPGPGDSGPATNRFFKVELDWGGREN